MGLRSWLRFSTLGIFGLVILLSFSMIQAGYIYDYLDTVDGVHLPDADAIVCLAGGRGRIATAGDLWYRYWELSRTQSQKKVPVLYISGTGPQANWGVVTRQLRSGVRDVIQPENVVIENESFNTVANARWFARYVTRLGIRRVILVTSPYHMMRAHMIFKKILPTSGENAVSIDTLSVFQEPFEPGEWLTSFHGVRVTVEEYLKWLYYRYLWLGLS